MCIYVIICHYKHHDVCLAFPETSNSFLANPPRLRFRVTRMLSLTQTRTRTVFDSHICAAGVNWVSWNTAA